ncbi:MAG: exodeoxyribonuclease VII large subunit [bacterium]
MAFFEAELGTAAPFSVTALLERVRARLESEFAVVSVEGEISNLSSPSSGHLYFSLKDDRSALRAALFRNVRTRLRFVPENGLKVVARGRVTVYPARGDLQMIVEALEPAGLGALMLAFEQLKRRLAAEGLFDPARKRALPRLPRRVGVVTSRTGAVIRDIVTVARRRFPNVEILLVPVRVQGEGAAAEIAAAIEWLSRSGRVDVMIVGRGGGSLEDLWAFNEEAVARAIVASRVPVVSAVGHETDVTIADFVADLRAPTPSAAAELVVPDRAALSAEIDDAMTSLALVMRRRVREGRLAVEHLAPTPARLVRWVGDRRQRVDEWSERIERAARRRTAAARDALAALEGRWLAAGPRRRIELAAERLAAARERLAAAARRTLAACGADLRALTGRLDALGPEAVLERGFAVVRSAGGAVIRDPREVREGVLIEVTVARGRFGARVVDDEAKRGSA